MGDEPEKSEASTAGTEGGGDDPSKAESGAAPGADAGSAKTKVILLAVLACIIAAVVVVFLVAGSGGKGKGTTTPAAPAGHPSSGGGGGSNATTHAAAGEETTTMSTTTPKGVVPPAVQEIPADFKACVVSCTMYDALASCTEIIHLMMDMGTMTADLTALKTAATANKDDQKRFYAAMSFTDFMAHKADFLPHIADMGAGILGIPADKISEVDGALKELKTGKAMKTFVGFMLTADLKAKLTDLETAVKEADMVILETHMMAAPKPCKVMPPSVWLVSKGAAGSVTFTDANEILKGLKTAGPKLSVSATVQVFKYTGAAAFDATTLYSGACTDGMMMDSFDAGACKAVIMDADSNSAVVTTDDKKTVYLYEDKTTLGAKMTKAKEDLGDIGLALFGSMCEDKSVTGCPVRPADPSAVETAAPWSPGGGPGPQPTSAKLYCVLGPCTTDVDPAMVGGCTDFIYYDPAMQTIATAPTDKTFSMFASPAPKKMHFMGFKAETFTAQMAASPAPDLTAYSSLSGIAVLDNTAAPATDIFAALKTAMAGKTFIFGIMYAAGLDLQVLGTDTQIILQTHKIDATPPSPCAVHPTTLWMEGGTAGMLLSDAVALATTIGEARTALSISLMGLKIDYSAAPADADGALTAACTTLEAHALADGDCTGTEDGKKNDAVKIDGTAAILYESEATAAAKKAMYAHSWAVFDIPCAAVPSCKTNELITAMGSP